MLPDDGGAEDREPLIRQDDDAILEHAPGSGTDSPARPTKVSLKNSGAVVRSLTLSAGISGLLFGFDTGVISSTLVSIGSDLSNRPLTTSDKSVVTAITSLLALFAAPTTGYFADKYGRKSVIFFPAILFALGAVIQAISVHVWTMVLGRALVGAAVGVASGAVPLYITELAPAELRGRLVTIQSLFITGGQVVAYLIGWLFASFPHGWRYMVGVGAVPAIVQLFLVPWMPETPRWLVQTSQDEHAQKVLSEVYCGLDEGDRERTVAGILSDIRAEFLAENKITNRDQEGASMSNSTLRELLRVPANRRALTIACVLQGFQQLCGFNSLMYFSASIFSLVGFASPIGTSLSVALTNFIFTMIAFAYIDVVGRRNILLWSIPFMMLGLIACSLAFIFIGTIEATPMSASLPARSFWPVFLLISMILYVSSYAVGLGCVPWQQSELFPLQVRSLGSGFATATNWTSNFLIGMTFLPMMSVLGPSITFAMYAAVCLIGWLCIFMIYPETAGLPIEKIGELLKDGWGVKESVISFAQRRQSQ